LAGAPEQAGQAWDVHVAAYEDSIKSAERAWRQSSLLSMCRADHVDGAMQTLRQGTGREISNLLTSMAHESYLAAAPLTPGFNAAAAAGLSSLVIGLIADDVATRLPGPRDPAGVASELIARGRQWIVDGEADSNRELARIAALSGCGAGVRTALIAPLGPVGVALRCVANADAAEFPFRPAVRAAAPVQTEV